MLNNVIAWNTNKLESKLSVEKNDIIITTALNILTQVISGTQTDGSSLSTANTQQDSFSIIWETISTKCLKPAADLASKVPIIGTRIAALIKSTTSRNITITNPNQVLAIGKNTIDLIISLKGNQKSSAMGITNILTKFSAVALATVKTLAKVMSATETDGSSLSTANTQQDSFSIIWETISTKCLSQAEAIARLIPFIGNEVAIMITNISKRNIQLINPNYSLVTGKNDINFLLNCNGCLGSTILVNMILNGVN